MTLNGRLNSALSNLDESALTRLQLEDWKNERPLDPALMSKASTEEALRILNRHRVFGRTFAQMPYVESVLARVMDLEKRRSLHRLLHQAHSDLALVRISFQQFMPDPITRSEYATLEEEARTSLRPVRLLLEMLNDQFFHRKCIASPVPLAPEPEEFEDLARRASSRGEATCKDTSEGLCVNLGWFCDYFGLEVPVHSELAGGFLVKPDSEEVSVARARQALRQVMTVIHDLPDEPPDLLERLLGDEGDFWELANRDPLVVKFLSVLQDDTQNLHRDVASFLAAVGSLSTELFFGHDFLVPMMFERLAVIVERLKAPLVGMEPLIDPFELPGADPALTSYYRAILEGSSQPAKPEPATPKPAPKKRRRGVY